MVDQTSPLEAEIRRRIAAMGPMPVYEFMQLSLSHPDYGYYMTRDPFGRTGDFTTAPEISQMFGELIGLWAAEVWRMMGEPSAVGLIELGPGRGTLMRDALRAAQVVAAFRKAIRLHLVETSPVLTQHQRATLGDFAVPIQWHRSLAEVPDAAAIIIANEFFDALPVHQIVKRIDGWHERVVRLDDGDRLAFGLADQQLSAFQQAIPSGVADAPVGSVYEWRSDQMAIEVCRRCLRGGAALVIDYGHIESAIGDTLQAVRRHRYDDPLAAPGSADLTAHVDFCALARSAEDVGARTHGPITQARFLRRLGIEARAAALRRCAPPERTSQINAALTRLTAGGERGMGTLFKVIGFSHPRLDTLPGFAELS